MGLRSELQEALTEAFDGDLSDVVVEFNVVQKNKGTYDYVEDSYAILSTVTTPSRGVFSSFGADEIDDVSILSEDEKVVIIGSDLPVSVRVHDTLILTGGSIYFIKNVKHVTGGEAVPIVVILQVRRNIQ